MKTILTLLLVCISCTGFGKSKQAYEKLCEVNKCWTEQPDVNQLAYPEYDNRSEREWIRTHLSLVEQTLRARSTSHLSAQQQANRFNALAHLNQYWHEGNFPVNDQYNYRTPIFIDKYDNFCAVGYLVKATGYEQVSRKIAAQTNLAYVREMNFPELFAWANEYGFTIDELAWIQPGYGWISYAKPMGKGTDGEVHELYADKVGDKLYVGGNFGKADSTILTANIAYITEQNGTYTWHAMGTGLPGTVYAITGFNNKIYAAGSFTAGSCVAYWADTAWQYIGCIGPVVKDLIVFNNELYAVGYFNVCASLSEVNFAKWNGTNWQQIPGLEGHVNTAHIQDDKLVLGGNFTYSGSNTNIIMWDSINGFTTYASAIQNEVKDIETHRGILFISCKATVDTIGLVSSLGTDRKWHPVTSYIEAAHDIMSYNTLCSTGDDLYTGGDFYDSITISPGAPCNHFGRVLYPAAIGGDYFAVDSSINVLVRYKNKMIAGGKFDTDYSKKTVLNSIALHSGLVSVSNISEGKNTVHIFPNPVKSGAELVVDNNIGATNFRLYDITGRLVMSSGISTDNKVKLKDIPAGNYIAELSNINGEKAVNKIEIK